MTNEDGDEHCVVCGSPTCPTLDESYEHSDECESDEDDPDCPMCEALDICDRTAAKRDDGPPGSDGAPR